MPGIRPGRAKGPWVGKDVDTTSSQITVSGDDTTPGYGEDKIIPGLGEDAATRNPAGNEKLEIFSRNPVNRDFFYSDHPGDYLEDTEVIRSGDWQHNTALSSLEGIAEGNTWNVFRQNLQGEFDVAIEVDRGSATRIGLGLIRKDTGNTNVYINKTATQLETYIEPFGSQNFSHTTTDVMWLRIRRRADFDQIDLLYKDNDDDPWTLLRSEEPIDAGTGRRGDIVFRSASGGDILDYWEFSNSPDRMGVEGSYTVLLDDGANIAVPAYKGNIFEVRITDDRTIDNPAQPSRGQEIALLIKQDGTGGRTITWDSKYTFPFGTVQPADGGGEVTAIRFLYNEYTDEWVCLNTPEPSGGDTVVEGQGVSTFTNNSSEEEVESGIHGFYDDFTDAALKPFWQDSDPITSNDWQLDAGTNRLDGNAQNNTKDVFRYAIEGDFDVSMKIDRNSASSCGFYADGNGESARLRLMSGQVSFLYTGETDIDVSVGTDLLWLRLRRLNREIIGYYKVNDSDAWSEVGRYTKNMGHDVDLSLDSATSAEIYQFRLWDNQLGARTRSMFPKTNTLTDASTISIDASTGDVFDVTLAGNRALGNPTSGQEGQKILIRVRQDGTGSRTLSYSSDYRFSSDLPSPTLSTSANALDYLGFMYNKDDGKWDFTGKVFGF